MNTPLLDLLTGSDSTKNPVEVLSKCLISREEWRPFPKIDTRNAWDTIIDATKAAVVAAGDDALDEPWSQLPATQYLAYARIGNRSDFEALYFSRRRRLASLVLAECFDNHGRFIDAIVDGCWLLFEESSWCLPAHVYHQSAGIGLPDLSEPTVDLFAAETAALLAWTDYLIGDRLEGVSSLLRSRLTGEVAKRVIDPCLERDDFWWAGFSRERVNNWNPWINSNLLACALLLLDDDRRVATVEKSLRSVDRFLGPYPDDGGCDEGPSYWTRAGASLFDFLELLSDATAGRYDAFAIEKVKKIGAFIYKVHIDGKQFVNFADAPAIIDAPEALVRRYGERTGDPDLESFGAWLLVERSPAEISAGRMGSPFRVLADLFWTPVSEYEVPARPQPPRPPQPPLPRDSWLDTIEVMTARDAAGSSRGLFLAAKGGHNEESHNHNDVGSFVVYIDGNPLVVDAGVETYSRKTFSDARYEIWTMQSAFHSLLPSVDGEMQAPGRSFAARDVVYRLDETTAGISLDIAGAYPPSAGIERWVRTIRLHRGAGVEIADAFSFSSAPQIVELSLLTPSRVVSGSGSGVIRFETVDLPLNRSSAAGITEFDEELFGYSVERIEISDERLVGTWGPGLNRVIFRLKKPERVGAARFRFAPK